MEQSGGVDYVMFYVKKFSSCTVCDQYGPGQGFIDARHLLFKHTADFPSHSEINNEKKGMFKVSVFLLLL